jgi:hypothetical protein
LSERIRIKRDREVVGDLEVLRRLSGERIKRGKMSTTIDGIWCG